jgi:adenine nucleotide transporter 17
MRALLMRRRGNTPGTPHALTTAEGIIAGLVAGEPLMLPLTESSRAQAHATGSITTLTTNPIWTVQTAQSTRAVTVTGAGAGSADGKVKKIKPSAIEAARAIYKQDGIQGFWRGIGPALILVINPVIQVSPVHLLRHEIVTDRNSTPPMSA